MLITKAHLIKLNPTKEQEQYFWQAAGIARFTFNWGLDRWNLYNDFNRKITNGCEGDKILLSGRLLKKEFNKIKPDFISDVTTWAHQGAFNDLQKAINNFWREFKKGTYSTGEYAKKKPRKDGRPHGWPRFKSRNKSTPSFYLCNKQLHFNDHEFWFDKKRVGWINMTEPLRFDGRILGGRISYQQGCWWLSVQVELEIDEPIHNDKAVGIDFGIKYIAVCSDGLVVENPRVYVKARQKLRILQRKLDRQKRKNNPHCFNEKGVAKKGCTWIETDRMRQTKKAIIKAHARIANIRQDIAHKLTTDLTNRFGVICIEDLNIKGMIKNRKLAKHIADAAWYEKIKQLQYKADYTGGIVVKVGRWFPSSKLCGGCDYVNTELKLSDREWTCPECGRVNERDENASCNIENEGLRILFDEQVHRTTQAGTLKKGRW